MASVAQVLANRSNAQKSTGPRTAEGKAAVAQNAVKHGLLAQRVVIKGEDPGEFELYRDRMLGELDPAGSMEAMLAERVVNLAWRLGRAERLECAALGLLEAKHSTGATAQPATLVRTEGAALPEGEAGPGAEDILARVVVQDFGDAKLLDQLLGYERRIENSLYRTMAELRRQRLVREAEEVSSLKCQVSREQSQLPSPPGLEAANVVLETSNLAIPPVGVTTNGADGEGLLCETNPIGTSPEEGQIPCGVKEEEVGRGRPTYEEGPCAVATNGAQAEEPACATKPIGGSPGDERVLAGEPTPAAAEPSGETKPMCAGES